jgi:hypothetical protein
MTRRLLIDDENASRLRVFVPIKRPKEYHKRRDKECFFNAADLAIADRGRYVEGFAVNRLGLAVHHAWITLDGVHAIDVTWQEPGVFYCGIEYDIKTVAMASLAVPFTGFTQLKPTTNMFDARA